MACVRRATFALAVVGCLATLATAPAAVAQTPAPIGTGQSGAAAFTYVGRVEQNGTLSVDFGYLDTIAGLDETLLYTGGDSLTRGETTGRFLYFTSATLLTRSVNQNLFITTGTAETTISFAQDGGASFDDPTSFKGGSAIATFTSTWQDIVNVQAPNQGIFSVVADQTQKTATPFTLEGTGYVLGAVGARTRLTLTGEGTRTDPVAPRASLLYGGVATVVSGTSGAPAAAASATSGWAVAGFVLGLVALAIALVLGWMVLRRGRRAVPAG